MEPNRGFWTGRKVCVTGGTGFLGFHLVQQLLDLGAEVRILALRPAAPHPLLDMEAVRTFYGDVRDPEVVRPAMAGCDIIFHTAGVVAVWGPGLELMHSVHVDGTRTVVAAAPRIARVVHTSSVVTIGASPTTAALSEESAFHFTDLKVNYVHAKRAAEQIALEAAGAQDIVVVNPGFMVGPEDYEPSIMGRFCTRYWKGRLPLAPPGGVNLVDVRDVARGHILAAEHGRTGRRFILGGENRTFPEFMIRLAGVAGIRPRAIWTMPGWALWAIASLAHLRSRVIHKEPYPSFQHARLNRYYWFYQSNRAQQELGYHARSVTASLGDAYRWHFEREKFRLRGFNGWWMRAREKQNRAA
ncbi:MAG TPA: NAD-dependent epimerase/dehydratase family protein [Gemmataceae bacterium]|jgi:dihydroflavonol-4-reductase|nr:NAD-dependent epimerase/dehydratase family protein [Gemmataceae bacterium]